MLRLILFTIIAGVVFSCQFQTTAPSYQANAKASPGAQQIRSYIELIENKNVALCVNHTSLLNDVHLVDSLQTLGINLSKVFTPEHGYKGQADAGEKVSNDSIGSLEIISLYGKNKKPSPYQMKGIDVMIFDMQDVGTRFYTYISTMHYVMEACAENNVPLIVLDRPNPNDFIDGPMLDTVYRSFVGMHEIPVVHGLTIGELAGMINGEHWLADSLAVDLTVIPVVNWSHGDKYELPVKPSPNLPNQQAINWYPTLCFFEGTYFSVGRGTNFPFQVVGSSDYPKTNFTFTPSSRPGAKYPKFEDIQCFGLDLRNAAAPPQIDLDVLIKVYSLSKKENFFNPYFNTLAGTDNLRKQIERGMTAQEIRESWKSELDSYGKLRAKYLLYPDDRRLIHAAN